MHIINEETSEIEERPVSVKLPKWIWGIIRERANYCHDGNLNEAFSEIMGMGLQYLGEKVTIREDDVPSDPSKWN